MALGVQQSFSLGTLLAVAIPLGAALLIAILGLVFVALRAMCVASREKSIIRRMNDERFRSPEKDTTLPRDNNKKSIAVDDDSDNISPPPMPAVHSDRRSFRHIRAMAPSTMISAAKNEDSNAEAQNKLQSQSTNQASSQNPKTESSTFEGSKSLGSPLGSNPQAPPSKVPSNGKINTSKGIPGQPPTSYPSPPPKSLARVSLEGLSRTPPNVAVDENNWRFSLAPTMKGAQSSSNVTAPYAAAPRNQLPAPSTVAPQNPLLASTTVGPQNPLPATSQSKYQGNINDSGTESERVRLYDMLRHEGDLREAPGPKSSQTHKGHTSIASYAGSVVSSHTRSNGQLKVVRESGDGSISSILPTPTEKKSNNNTLGLATSSGMEKSGIFSNRSSGSRSSSFTSSYGTAMATQGGSTRNASGGGSNANNANSTRFKRLSAEAYSPAYSKFGSTMPMQVNKPLPLTPSPKPGATSSPLTTPQGLEHGVLRNLSGALHRVIFPYRPQLSDELELHPNSIIKVYQVFDDGWCVGVVDDNGKVRQGICPRACLEQV